MAAIEAGKTCVLRSGRRMGEDVEVVKLLDESFALVKTKKDKERKVVITQLDPKKG